MDVIINCTTITMLNMYILVDYQGDFEWNKNAGLWC